MVMFGYLYMGLEEKLLEAPEFRNVGSLARWYVKNRDDLVQDDPEKETLSAVEVAAMLIRLGKIPKENKQKLRYFRRQMYSIDYILNTTVQDEGDNSANIMRGEIERILDNIDIELRIFEGHFPYSLLRRTIRRSINRGLFTKRGTGKQVSDNFLDDCIFIASELWGEEYALKYLLERCNYSKFDVGKKLKISEYHVSKKLNEHGIKIKELMQNRYKVIQDGGIFYISMRLEEDIPIVYFTPKYLTEKLGVERQGFSKYLHKRAKIPKESSRRIPIRLSQGVYRDILDSYSDSLLRNFSVSVNRGHNYAIRNHGESESNPTSHTGRELRTHLGVKDYIFNKIIAILNIPPDRQNRYWLSEKAFKSIVAIYGPK